MNGRNPILFMNLMKISIVKYAIKNETNKPNRLISKFSTRYAESILISKYTAIAEIVGIDIKKLILDAVLLSSPRNNPAEIVTPDLDTPLNQRESLDQTHNKCVGDCSFLKICSISLFISCQQKNQSKCNGCECDYKTSSKIGINKVY